MQPLDLASSSVLKVFEHFDVDAFRAPLNSSLIRIVPTRAGRISAMQAVLALPHCEIYLLRTFPRIVDLEVPANHTVVLFSMVGTSDTIINGQTTRPPIPRTWSRADRLQDGRRRPDLRSRNPFQIRHACSSRQGVSRHEFARCAARTFLPKQPSHCQTYRRQAFGKLGKAIYSDELASELRISVRTMHTAMLKIRGMSLHRYLR